MERERCDGCGDDKQRLVDFICTDCFVAMGLAPNFRRPSRLGDIMAVESRMSVSSRYRPPGSRS